MSQWADSDGTVRMRVRVESTGKVGWIRSSATNCAGEAAIQKDIDNGSGVEPS